MKYSKLITIQSAGNATDLVICLCFNLMAGSNNATDGVAAGGYNSGTALQQVKWISWQ